MYRHRRTNSQHHVQDGQSLHYRARDASASAFPGALRDVSIVGQTPRSATNAASAAAATTTSNNVSTGDDECSICHDDLFANNNNDPVTKIQVCGHDFHDACLRNWLQRGPPQAPPSCPTCRAEVPRQPKPTAPTGTMTIQLGSDGCPGFDPNTTCIEIIYSVPSGLQLSYHDNPSTRYPGTTRRAYLPDNDGGRQLLKRLKLAFERGLTFDVGTSLTNGWHDQVVWTRMFDHKTTLLGGPYGFPDPNYLQTCNVQLDAIGIPPAGSIPNQPLRHGEVVNYDAPQNRGPVVFMPDALAPVARRQRAAPLPAPAVAAAAPVRNHGHLLVETPHQALPDAECSVCREPLSRKDASQIILCNHVFHRACLLSCLNVAPRCPICRRTVGEPQGPSPSGCMTVTCERQRRCPGFGSAHTVTIVYRIPSGVQETYHENPGARFTGTERKAYLPNTREGCELLTRLKYAFKHGLTFTVGTSLTTGRRDVVTWTSIPHKTSFNGANGDPHGFPDDKYLTNCNSALDALGVPSADDCLIQPQTVTID